MYGLKGAGMPKKAVDRQRSMAATRLRRAFSSWVFLLGLDLGAGASLVGKVGSSTLQSDKGGDGSMGKAQCQCEL
jgi:hypothetical protein